MSENEVEKLLAYICQIHMLDGKYFDVFSPDRGRYPVITSMARKNMFHPFSGGIPNGFPVQIIYI